MQHATGHLLMMLLPKITHVIFVLIFCVREFLQQHTDVFHVVTRSPLGNEYLITEKKITRSEIHCANWCAMTATCMSAVFNSTTMHCGLYREYQSASNSSPQEEQLILQKDVSTTTSVSVESGTTDMTHESDMSTTKQTTTSTTEIDDTSTITNRITGKATEEASTSRAKTTTLTTEAATISSQQKNWTALGAADCYLTTSTEYVGTISYTVNGIPCQYWNTHTPHTRNFNPLDTTAYDTNYCRETTNREGGPGCYTSDPAVYWEYCFIVKCDACGVDERLPVAPTETKYHFLPSRFIGMVFTCDTLSPGTSIEHCPVSQCGSDDQWTTGYSVSCTDEDCYTGSATYQGKVTCTVAGITCDVWTTFGAMPAGHPDKNTNYCRDPDNTGAPWCYTTDPDVRWDYCPVPKCA